MRRPYTSPTKGLHTYHTLFVCVQVARRFFFFLIANLCNWMYRILLAFSADACSLHPCPLLINGNHSLSLEKKRWPLTAARACIVFPVTQSCRSHVASVVNHSVQEVTHWLWGHTVLFVVYVGDLCRSHQFSMEYCFSGHFARMDHHQLGLFLSTSKYMFLHVQAFSTGRNIRVPV